MKLVHGNSGKKVRGITSNEIIKIDNIPISYRTGTLSPPSYNTILDTIYAVTTGGEFDMVDQQLTISVPLTSDIDFSYTIDNLTPSVANFNASTNYLTAQITDYAVIQLNSKYQKQQFTFNVSKEIAVGASSTLSDFVAGSLRKHIKDYAFSVILGKTGDNPWGTYTPSMLFNNSVETGNPTSNPAMQNQSQWLGWDFYHAGGYTLSSAQYNQWLYYQSDNYTYWVKNTPANTGTGTILNSVNLTSINLPYFYTTAEIQAVYPSYVSGSGMGTCATLISPRHVYGASHWHPYNGMIVKFMGTDGIVYTRTIVNSVTDAYHDIWVGILDSDLPATVKPMKVLPTNYARYLPAMSNSNINTTPEIPAFMVFSSRGDIHLAKYREDYIGYGLAAFPKVVYSNPSDIYSSLSSWQLSGFFGSGSPVFTIINGEAVLLFCLWGGGTNGYSGASIHQNQALVNIMMATLGTSYQLTNISLTGFNTY